MKNSKTPAAAFTLAVGLVFSGLLMPLVHQPATAQGMSAEIRNNIHTLFSQHTKVTRKVTLTESGYIAVTEAQDPKLAAVLKKHVQQMSARLGSGRMIRGWDPAFREMVQHYPDITHQLETTPMGLKITVTGKTPAAIKVAQNHANIVSRFAQKGWAEHDIRHPRVADQIDINEATPDQSNVCAEGTCCLNKKTDLAGEKDASPSKMKQCRNCAPAAQPSKEQELKQPN